MQHQETGVVGSTVTPTGPSKSLAVTAIGLLTIVWGSAHAILGGCFLFAGDDLQRSLRPSDPMGGLAPVLWITARLMIWIGVAFLLGSVPGMLAGLGVLWRKPWGRILAFIMAVVAVLVGLLSLSAYQQDAPGNTIFVAFGAAEILYGVLAVVTLILKGAAFSRPGV